jgi:hypothetical protein
MPTAIYKFDENLNKETVFQYTPPTAITFLDLPPCQKIGLEP